MTNSNSKVKFIAADHVEEGMILSYHPHREYDQHVVSSVSSNSMGNVIIRTGNDTSSLIYSPDELICIVDESSLTY